MFYNHDLMPFLHFFHQPYNTSLDNNMALNFGVIGFGLWGPNIVRALRDNERVCIRSICDKKKNVLSKTNLHLPEEISFTHDYKPMLNDPEIDAIVVATPATTHAEIVSEALKHGKHVLCEKPMAFDPVTAKKLFDLAESHDLKLMVGFTFLFNNGIVTLKALIENNQIGDVYYMKCQRTHPGPIREDVDAMWDLAPHDVAISHYLFGAAPTHVRVLKRSPLNTDFADLALIWLEHAGGAVTEIHVNWVDAIKVRSCEVVGSLAKIVFDDINTLEPIRIFKKGVQATDSTEPDFGAFRYLLHHADIVSPKVLMVEPLKQEIEAFVGLVLDSKPVVSDAELTLGVIRTMAALDFSADNKGILVEVV